MQATSAALLGAPSTAPETLTGRMSPLKGQQMKNFVSYIRTAARNRAAYNRTVAELASLPSEALRDLHMARCDIPHVAHVTVYGF